MDFAAARRHMIDSQILPNKVIDDRIIDAMADLPREAFVPEAKRGIAYVDEALSIGSGRYLMEPMIIARMLQAVQIRDEDVVLSIGCGTGYAAALLARMASTVVAIESDKKLAKLAQDTLARVGVDTVAVLPGDLSKGYAKQAPYDVIFFDGAVQEIPANIEKQLADGGRLIAVVQAASAPLGEVVMATRHAGVVTRRSLFDAGTPLLPGFEKEEAFSL